MSVYGFRRWQVNDDGLLLPAFLPRRPGFVWPPDEPTTAECNIPRMTITSAAPIQMFFSHGVFTARTAAMKIEPLPGVFDTEVPHRRCGCGLWIHSKPIQSCGCPIPSDDWHGVVGVARCWGRYVRHATGWRFEHATPVAVVDFTGRLSDRYAVPRYPTLEALYGEWAPDADGWASEPDVWCSIVRQRHLKELTAAMEHLHTIMQSLGPTAAKVAAATRLVADRLGVTVQQVEEALRKVSERPEDNIPPDGGTPG